MSQNHTHDKDLLDRIERAASEKQPGGLPVLDDLARTVPQAKPAFQQQLESHLVAHLYMQPTSHQEDSMETLQIAAPLNRPTTNRRVTIPATLVATLIMVLLGGSILLILRSPQQGQTGAALIQATATPFAPTAVFTLTATPFAPTATFTATPILPTSSPVPLSTTRRGIVISLIGVKVHETPDIESQVLMTLAYESAVQVIGVSLNGMWLNILLDDGRQAWIVSELVEMDSGTFSLTPTIVPPDMMATLPFTLTPT
ncbi:MAG: SH3 domain-containing protein, partial [Anaerolineae bacterium]|nr:SH3 domain-containing protein [Anaerolineae bacterium]